MCVCVCARARSFIYFGAPSQEEDWADTAEEEENARQEGLRGKGRKLSSFRGSADLPNKKKKKQRNFIFCFVRSCTSEIL